jgi:hypothetical protein
MRSSLLYIGAPMTSHSSILLPTKLSSLQWSPPVCDFNYHESSQQIKEISILTIYLPLLIHIDDTEIMHLFRMKDD